MELGIEKKRRRRKNLLRHTPRTIERWCRLKGIRLAHQPGRILARARTFSKEKNRRAELEKTIRVVKRRLIESRHSPYFALETIFNLALYFLIAERDIQTVKMDALTHSDPRRRSLCLRVILLTVYEIDLDQAAGKNLRRALQAINAPSNLKNSVYEALSSVREARTKVVEQVDQMRNNAIAHRDGDALLQCRIIENLSEGESFQLIAQFYEATEKFQEVIPNLVAHASSPNSLLRQLRSNPKYR